jgi:DNA-binding beta-propeller fold protein YncE
MRLSKLFLALLCLSLSVAQAVEVVPQSGRAIEVGPSVTGIAVAKDNNRVFVTDNKANTLSEIDLSEGRVVRVVQDEPLPESKDGCFDNFCRGVGAVGVAVSADGSSAYVTSLKKDSVSRVDLKEGKVLWSTLVQRFPQNVLLSPDEKTVWVFNLVGNSISSIDAETGAKIGPSTVLEGGNAGSLPFGRPVGFALSTEGDFMYVSSAHVDALDVYSTKTRQRVHRIAGGAPFDLRFDQKNNEVWALYRDGLVAFDASTNEAIRGMRYCGPVKAYQFALSPDGQYVALTLPEEEKVLLASRETGLLTHVFETGKWPSEVVFSSNSKQLLTVNSSDKEGVSVFDLGVSLSMQPHLGTVSELFCMPGKEE